MLAHVRTLLDEASAGYWTDTEIYRSLTNGQTMTASKLHIKGSSLIENLRKDLAQSEASGWLNLPSDYWFFIGVKYASVGGGTEYPCLLRRGARFNKESNAYLAGTSSQPYVYVTDNTLDFDPSGSSGMTPRTYTLSYYSKPTDISASVEPILLSITHPAITQYAFAELLLKDEKNQESALEFQKYNDMVASL